MPNQGIIPLEIYRNKKKSVTPVRYTAGFTFIELLLVIALMSMLGAVTYPLSMSFFTEQILDDTSSEFVAILRETQSKAMSQEHDSSFGVKILSDAYVVFEGETYVLRTESEDQVFPLPFTTTISGFDEIVFAKYTGIPSVTDSATISIQNKTATVTISALGVIEN